MGDTKVLIVVSGKKAFIHPMPCTAVINRVEVVHPFDTYFNLTLFTVELEQNNVNPHRSP